MIEKSCHSLLTPGIDYFSFYKGKELIKQASYLEPAVEKFAEKLSPEKGYNWVLVHAIGAGEWYDSNRNGDIAYEKALNHVPPNWTGDPVIDRVLAKNWVYGWPTFYNGYCYPQHSNKLPEKALGIIELAVWNDRMKRVELVIKIDREKAEKLGAGWALRKLDKDALLDVSMGMRVGFDLETVSCDYDAYSRALATFNPKVHRGPAHAVLLYHKLHPIRGLSITRNDYTELGKYHINKIFPDGRKVMLDNTFPRFFDISIVFIGAEPPAKIMTKLATKCDITGVKCEGECIGPKCAHYTPSGAYLRELETREGNRMAKTAADKQKTALVSKKGTISKDVGSTFNPKALGSKGDELSDLPKNVLDAMAKKPLDASLSTSGLSGVVLKPHEFQRIILIKMDKKDLADSMDDEKKVFKPVEDTEDFSSINHDSFHSGLFSMLRDFLPFRSMLSPFRGLPPKVRKITIVIANKPRAQVGGETLDKISAAYNGYRKDLLEHFSKEATLALNQNLSLRNELYKYSSDFGMVDEETLQALRDF